MPAAVVHLPWAKHLTRIKLMKASDPSYPLRGKLLIAMPGMGDPRFEKSVIFMCDHSENGAMGLIVNKSAPEIRFAELVEQLDIDTDGPIKDIPIHFGGPVENGRGFVLHSSDYDANDSTLVIDGQFGMTATLDVVQDLAGGSGPRQAIFALGYSGWGPGQLEDEIQQNGWLTCEASSEIVFGADDSTKWSAALKTLGVDALTLSASAGRA